MRTLIFTAALALVLPMTAQAQTNCRAVGNSVFCDDGSSAHFYGRGSYTVSPGPSVGPTYPWQGALMGQEFVQRGRAEERQQRAFEERRTYIPPRCTKTGYVYSCE